MSETMPSTGSAARILVAEDDPVMRDFMRETLLEAGYEVSDAATAQEAATLAAGREFAVLITDVRMPGGSGIELAGLFRRDFPATGVIVVSGYPDDDMVKRGEELEVSSFLVKPFSGQQLRYSVIGALQKRQAVLSSIPPAPAAGSAAGDLGMAGASAYLAGLRRAIHEAGAGGFPVLIEGPSGTGKELIAHAIHACSGRRAAPLITINCAAIPRHLEESEFFGHVKGAFTGASSMKHGIIASADGSSLFLDEIGELSLETQAKLLRVLDTGEFIRIGETQPRRVDIRIISATNRDLEEMVAAGTFRKDLYFRLKGAVIATLPLREHREDIPALVQHFLARHSQPNSPRHITAEAMGLLVNREWPGNIRELKHVIDRLATAARGLKRIGASTVRSVLGLTAEPLADGMPYQDAKDELLRRFETEYFTKLLQRFNGNANQAAKSAGMHRPNLLKKLKALGISPDTYRSGRSVSRAACGAAAEGI